MMQEDIDDILANFLNNEPLSESEKRLFEEWKQQATRNEQVGRIVQKLEQEKRTLDKHQQREVVFRKIERRVRQAKRKRQRVLWSSCAAGVAMVIGLFFIQQEYVAKKENTIDQTYISGLSINRPAAEIILPNGKKRLLSREKNTIIVSDSNREMHTYKETLIVESHEEKVRGAEYYTMNVPFGAEYNVVLPDGTKIYLNAGSSLRYPDHFTGDNREVYITGEAYFEVAPDSLHPFIVHASDVAIRVLGTSFNVNAYPDGTWIRTTLVQGKVEARCGDNKFMMQPGTQVAYNKETREADYFPVDTQQFISWKDGFYDFEDMPLEELMNIFIRWYNVKIEFATPELREIKFSGRLKRYDDLRPLFEMLEYTRDVRFIVGKDKIVIQSK